MSGIDKFDCLCYHISCTDFKSSHPGVFLKKFAPEILRNYQRSVKYEENLWINIYVGVKYW